MGQKVIILFEKTIPVAYEIKEIVKERQRDGIWGAEQENKVILECLEPEKENKSKSL